MDYERELERVADGYRGDGYEVVVRPRPDQLPPFAATFRVEIAARRGARGVLASVKPTRSDLATDPEVPNYAEATGREPGWRFDLFILATESSSGLDGRELTGSEVAETVEHARELGRAGYGRTAIVPAWAALEAAARLKMRAIGRDPRKAGTPRQVLRELFSAGAMSPDEFRRAEVASALRNQIVHGFASTPGEFDDYAAVVRQLTDLAERFVNESLVVPAA